MLSHQHGVPFVKELINVHLFYACSSLHVIVHFRSWVILSVALRGWGDKHLRFLLLFIVAFLLLLRLIWSLSRLFVLLLARLTRSSFRFYVDFNSTHFIWMSMQIEGVGLDSSYEVSDVNITTIINFGLNAIIYWFRRILLSPPLLHSCRDGGSVLHSSEHQVFQKMAKLFWTNTFIDCGTMQHGVSQDVLILPIVVLLRANQLRHITGANKSVGRHEKPFATKLDTIQLRTDNVLNYLS